MRQNEMSNIPELQIRFITGLSSPDNRCRNTNTKQGKKKDTDAGEVWVRRLEALFNRRHQKRIDLPPLISVGMLIARADHMIHRMNRGNGTRIIIVASSTIPVWISRPMGRGVGEEMQKKTTNEHEKDTEVGRHYIRYYQVGNGIVKGLDPLIIDLNFQMYEIVPGARPIRPPSRVRGLEIHNNKKR
ncbi:hypothetical protein Btru_024121 [Bulinus truncatus]|nr:hypothetical protein Btru_024121 [Bulinus truncatus]